VKAAKPFKQDGSVDEVLKLRRQDELESLEGNDYFLLMTVAPF
jgi:hypothetical protein